MKHVVNFSGGLCSFWAAHRVVEKYGTKDVTLLFADTLVEDDELYIFNQKSAQILGVPITRISKEMTPWELFRKQGMIGNSRYPICSVYLKREILDKWHIENCLEMDTVIYLGFDWKEAARLNDIRNAKPRWRWEAPMLDEPLWDKCKMQHEAELLGLKIPRLYLLGFPHNNCGGRCVRAGISHWVHLYRVLPNRYLEWEEEEAATNLELARRGISSAGFSMLKDRRGGAAKTLTLRMLRDRIEAGEKLPTHEWGGCGCAGEYLKEPEEDDDDHQVATPSPTAQASD